MAMRIFITWLCSCIFSFADFDTLRRNLQLCSGEKFHNPAPHSHQTEDGHSWQLDGERSHIFPTGVDGDKERQG